MKLTPFLIAGALATSLALPLAASAQQSPQPPYYPQQQMQQPGAPMQRNPQNLTTPSVYQLQAQFGRQFANLGVTGQQQAQITSLINAFAQTHPEGSPRDRKGMKELRQEILSVLSPQQQAQYEQQRAQQQAARAQQRQQRMQQQAQQQGQPPYQGQPQYQGQPPYQGSPVPPQQPPSA